MKKIYFAPQANLKTVIVKNRMLAGSIIMTGNPADVNGDGDYNTLSRENDSFIQPHSVWDE